MKLIFIPSTQEAQAVPAFYLKPDTALLRNNQPFFYPDFTQDVRATLSFVLRINRLGRSISKQFAARYFDAVSLGLDLTAYDILQQCVTNHLPQDTARSFDYAAPISTDFIPVAPPVSIADHSLHLLHNGCEINTPLPLFCYTFEEIIAQVSQFITLKIGDYIYVNTPLNTPTLQINDELTIFLHDREMLKMAVK